MKYIVKYKNFNESKGISDSCEKVLYDIWKNIEDDIINLKSDKIKFDINEDDFKCKNIKLSYYFLKGDDNLCNGQTILKGSELIDSSLSNLDIKLDIVYKKIDDEFIYYIKSVLLHELLHIFQHYNILSKNKFRPESFSIGSIIPQLRKIVKTKYGEYILDILYYSLSHELSAQLHQYYLYRVNKKEYKRIDDIKMFINNFKIVDLSDDDKADVNLIKKHIYESVKYFTKNNNYLKNIKKSLWNQVDVYVFLNKLKNIIDSKVKWIDNKKTLIDKKIEYDKVIKYDENTTLPHNWEMYDIYKINEFIRENLSDIRNEDFI
jgi:hypothetical protein